MSLNAVMGVLILGAAPQGLSIGILVLGVVIFLIGCWLSWTATQDAKAFRESRQELEEEVAYLKAQAKTKPKAASPKKKTESTAKTTQPDQTKVIESIKKDLTQTQADLKKLRQDNQQLREKNHTMSTELKDFRTKDKANRDKKKEVPADNNTQTALVDLRFDLAEAKQDAETWKQRASELEAALNDAPAPAPTPEPVVETKEAPVSDVDLGDVMDSDAVKAELKNIEKQHRVKLDRAQKDHQQAEKELRGKLKRTSLNSERQRRRADNNDRAYTITQRELDAARERIKFLEEQLNKANFAASTATNQLIAQASAEPAQDENAETELDNSLRAALADTSTLQEVSAIDDAWLDLDVE